MKKIYEWIKTNKMISGVIISTALLVILNLILIAQFVNILNSFSIKIPHYSGEKKAIQI